MNGWGIEAKVYFSHVVGLVVPGRRVQTHDIGKGPVAVVGNLQGWSDEELDLLIDEGRRTFETQAKRFDRVRSTAQILLPTASAVLIVLGAELAELNKTANPWLRAVEYAIWTLGTLLVVLSVFGAGAILTVRSDFGTLLPTLISQQDPPIKRVIAQSYARQTMVGEITVATRVTVVRDATALFLLGGTFHLVLWFLRTIG